MIRVNAIEIRYTLRWDWVRCSQARVLGRMVGVAWEGASGCHVGGCVLLLLVPGAA